MTYMFRSLYELCGIGDFLDPYIHFNPLAHIPCGDCKNNYIFRQIFEENGWKVVLISILNTQRTNCMGVLQAHKLLKNYLEDKPITASEGVWCTRAAKRYSDRTPRYYGALLRKSTAYYNVVFFSQFYSAFECSRRTIQQVTLSREYSKIH
ncbi:hypothetical protein Q1695_016030 [Nippostrongylus brasiliensis]|nr:hypothetical protein Q1695_016030 [Nippostrongylus brasiliensis]